MVGVTADLTSRFSAVELVRVASEALGGKGGGGRPDMAQAGGPDGAKADAALAAIEKAMAARDCAPGRGGRYAYRAQNSAVAGNQSNHYECRLRSLTGRSHSHDAIFLTLPDDMTEHSNFGSARRPRVRWLRRVGNAEHDVGDAHAAAILPLGLQLDLGPPDAGEQGEEGGAKDDVKRIRKYGSIEFPHR